MKAANRDATGSNSLTFALESELADPDETTEADMEVGVDEEEVAEIDDVLGEDSSVKVRGAKESVTTGETSSAPFSSALPRRSLRVYGQ